jgi:hypothetical protein
MHIPPYLESTIPSEKELRPPSFREPESKAGQHERDERDKQHPMLGNLAWQHSADLRAMCALADRGDIIRCGMDEHHSYDEDNQDNVDVRDNLGNAGG